jgi:predicted nucleotidyltransferase
MTAVAGIRYPTPLHRRVLAAIVADARTDPDVRGLLLAGSLARGTARADSDIDILAVTSGQNAGVTWRSAARPLPADILARTAGEWRARFAPDRPGDESWGYAFLDGVVLDDPEGIVSRLVSDAGDVHERYRVPASVKAHYTRLWHHVRPKMAAVLGHGDPVEIGWASAAMTNDLLRTVWAANDLPNPSLDLGTLQRHLDDLTIPASAPAELRAILRAHPEESLRRQLSLIDTVLPHLQGSPKTGSFS